MYVQFTIHKYVAALLIYYFPGYIPFCIIIIVLQPWQSAEIITPNHMQTHYARCTKTSVRLEEPGNWRSRNNHKRDIRGRPTSAWGLCVCACESGVCVRCTQHYVTFEWCNAVPERISRWWQKSTSDSPELRLLPLRNSQSHAPRPPVGWQLNVSQWVFFFFLIQWIISFDPLYLFAKSVHVYEPLLFALIKLLRPRFKL